MQRFTIELFGPNNGWASIYDRTKRCYCPDINTTASQAQAICNLLNEVDKEKQIIKKRLARHYE